MKTLLKNARIIKMNETPVFVGDILINEKRIEKVGENITEDADEVIDCEGNILLPGFKNAHAHGAMTFLRGGGKGLALQDWLFTYCFPREDHLIGSDVYKCSKVAFKEYIEGGITAALDQYFFPLETAKAADEIGFRVSMNACIDEEEEIIRVYNEYNFKKDSLVNYQVGAHAEYTFSDKQKEVLSNVIKKLHSPFYVHMSETRREVDECFQKRGMSPVQYFDSLGFYDYGGGGYHCNYLTDEDIEIYKKRKCFVITNPGSNLYLNSGACPVQKYFDRGLEVAIGTDGPASNVDLDMFYEMRLIHKNNPNLPCYEILKMATVNGAKAIRIFDCDTLIEGKFADIIMLDKSLIDSTNNVFDSIIENGTKDLVKMTMINGKILYRDREFFINEDISKIYKDCEDVAKRIDGEIL